jgi:hypothetical protein
MAKATRATLRERWQDWLPQYLEHGVDGVLRAAAAEGIELSATNVKAYYWSKGIKRRELMRARKRAAQPSPAPEPDESTVADEVTRDLEFEGLRREIRIWKRKYEEATRRHSLEQTIAGLMRDYRQAMPIPKVSIPSRVPRTVRTKESLVLLLSDLHVGETVDAEQMHGVNKYDIDVFLARMELLADKIEEIAFDHLTGYEFEELVVLGLGDLVNGMLGAIHDELIVTQASDLMETVYGLAYVLVQFFARMRTRFARVRTYWAPGNHGRMTKKPMAKDAHINWDMVVPQIVSTFFAEDSGVEFNIPNSFFFVAEVRGQRILGFHGHQVRGFASIPWYGINRFVGSLAEVLADRDIRIDHVVMGHFHTEMIMDRVRGEVIASPCMKGADEYALSAGFKPVTAGQTLFGLHEEHGVTHRWRINLQQAYEPRGLFQWYPGGALGDLWKKAGR